MQDNVALDHCRKIFDWRAHEHQVQGSQDLLHIHLLTQRQLSLLKVITQRLDQQSVALSIEEISGFTSIIGPVRDHC